MSSTSAAVRTSVVVSVLLMAGAAMAAEMTVPVCEQPPALDGALDDPCWEQAEVIEDFEHLVYGSEDAAITDHTVRLLRDDAWLYAAFDIHHPQPDSIAPVQTQHDSRVQGENCVKLSFAAGEAGADYMLFRLSAGNVRSEQRTRGGVTDIRWDIPWRSGTHIGGRGWQAEIALPLSLLTTAEALETARINVMTVLLIPEEAPEPELRGYQRTMVAWSPTDGTSSYLPERIFDTRVNKIARPFLPYLEDCAIGEYFLQDGQTRYRVTATLREFGGTPGEVDLRVIDLAEEGATSDSTERVELPAHGEQSVEIVASVAGIGERTTRLEMIDPDTGEVLQWWVPESLDALEMLDAYVERSFYTDEIDGIVVCEARLPESDLSDATLVALDETGGVIGEEREVAPATDLHLPLADIAPGEHQVRIELLDGAGRTLAAREVTLAKRESGPGTEVKIDHRRRIALLDGEPFFPLGFWYLGGNLGGLEEMGDAGFNAVSRRDTIEEMGPFLDEAAEHGLMVVPRLTGFGASHESGQSSQIGHVKAQMIYSAQRGDTTYAERSRIFQEAFEKELPSMLEGVRHFRDHPALLCWYTIDEPANKGSYALYRQGRQLTNRVADLDPYHPMWMLGMAGVKTAPEDTDWCDIIGHDPYWVPARVGRQGISYVTSLTERVRKVADEERKPAWMVLIGERIAASYKRYLNAREIRCQTYLAMIAGARGILYYHAPIRFHENWQMLEQLAGEVNELAPALLNTEVPHSVEYHVGESRYRLGDVETAFFRHPDGRLLMLSANYRNFPVDATWRIAGLPDSATLARLFGEGTLSAEDGAFSARLGAFETRAWELRGEIEIPAEIRVEMTRHEELAETEADALAFATGRPGKRNMLPNPSFEQATNHGWPDYYDPPWFARMAEDRIGTPGCPYALDTANPWHGEQSLRIEARQGNRLKLWMRASGPLVLSAWLRADDEGVPVRVYCGAKVEGTLGPLTEDWARYSVRLPDGTGGWIAIAPQPESTVWIDGLQLEAGETMTEFDH